MIRYSKLTQSRAMVFAAVVWTTCFTVGAARSEDVFTDAFGIVPIGSVSSDRLLRSVTQRVSDGSNEASVHIFVGPKSLEAGGDNGLATAVVLDAQGSLVPDGTEVTFFLDGQEIGTIQTRYGIATVPLAPGSVAVGFSVGAVAAGGQSQRATYRVTPDVGSLSVGLLPQLKSVSHETLAPFTSGPILDQYGNVVDDGTAASIVLFHDVNHFSYLPTRTVRGNADVSFLVRDVPSFAQVVTNVGSQLSTVRAFNAVPIIFDADLPVRLSVQADLRAMLLEIGPFLTSSGHQLTDGSKVSATISDSAGNSRTFSGWVQDGVFSRSVAFDPRLAPFTLVVEAQKTKFEYFGLEADDYSGGSDN
ncbi:MAG: hypothetical protein JJ894_08450 [Dinoroseobacter sp.]|nr:hypothetical protein [Dinoroseobacter sp.]